MIDYSFIFLYLFYWQFKSLLLGMFKQQDLQMLGLILNNFEPLVLWVAVARHNISGSKSK